MKTRSFCEDQDSYDTTEKEGDLCLWTVLARYLCGSRSFYQDYSVRGLKLCCNGYLGTNLDQGRIFD